MMHRDTYRRPARRFRPCTTLRYAAYIVAGSAVFAAFYALGMTVKAALDALMIGL